MPLEEIRRSGGSGRGSCRTIRVAVRTGDTPPSERQAMLRKPPHILVTTPESLYLLLTGAKSREILRNVRTVIVDEIHALARDKRGSHLSLSLARLDRIVRQRRRFESACRPRSGRSTKIARFLVGTGNVGEHGIARCRIIDAGHVRELDLAIEVPPSELSAVCPSETWQEIYARLSELIRDASQHAGVRQHAAAGRASVRIIWKSNSARASRQPSRQPVARDAAAGRRAAQDGAAEGDRRDGVARAGHRYRLHRPGLPDRLAAVDRDVLAARRPRRACAGAGAEGAAVCR